jgi:hypothetical protein
MEEAEIFLGEDHIWADYQPDGDPRPFGARWAAFLASLGFSDAG